MFSDRFKLDFTPEEQTSLMINKMLKIGDDMEMALVSEIQAAIASNTDRTQMSANGIRKNLSSRYILIRNFTAAYADIYIAIQEATGPVTIISTNRSYKQI